VYESSAGKPDADEGGDELTQPDAVGSLEDVEVLQNVWDGHQTKSSRKPQTCTAHRRQFHSYTSEQQNSVTARADFTT